MKRLMLTLILCLAGGLVPGLTPTADAQFTITGTVTGGGGAAVDSVEVRLFTGTGFPIGIPLTYSNPAGTYAVAGLPSGQYVLQFRPPVATRLVATNLPATVAGANAVRNAPLPIGHLLSGFVRNGAGVGIPAIDLQVRDRVTGNLVLTPGDDTNAAGFYDVVVPTGEFDVEWRAVAPGSLPWIPFADRLLIDTDTQYDVTLHLGLLVSGLVTDGFGAPLGAVNLDFVDAVTGLKALTPGDNTAPDGTFTALVPAGTYNVIAKPLPATRLLAGWLPGVVVDGAVSGVDFALAPGFLLSGIVSGAAGAIEGVDLDVTDAVTGIDLLTPFDVTDAAGQYQIVVPAGLFHVAFSPPTGTFFAPQVAAGIAVTADRILNMNLPAGVVFAGVVTASGLPVVGTDIDLKDPLTGLNVPLTGDHTDALGAFSTVAAPGTYILEIEPPLVAGLVAQRNSGFVLSGPTNLPVVLVAGNRVTGLVTTHQGLPLGGVNVDVLRAVDGAELFTPGDHTNALGRYNVVIPADNYTFRFKLGVGYAVPDSVFVGGLVITTETVVDAAFAGAISGVNEQTPLAVSPALAARPNPFNPTTTIAFELRAEGPVRLTIHSLDGHEVAVLADEMLNAGPHAVAWHGRDTRGRALPSGVYVAALVSEGAILTTKISLIK